MSEINNSGFNPKDVKVQPYTSTSNANKPEEKAVTPEPQQKDASAPVTEALGKSLVSVDNHDADMQRLLNNPKIADTSDKMYNAAIGAGVSAPEAATFATAPAK